MARLPRSGLVSFCVGVLVSSFGVARADEVLVYQRDDNDLFGADAASERAAEVLESLGHTVTHVSSLTASLPADLSVFDTVWGVTLEPFTGPEQTQLVDFVKAGGGVYLTGERPCCENVNGAVSNVLGRLLGSTFIVGVGHAGEGGDAMTANAADPFGVTTRPNAVPTWMAAEAGLMTSVPADRVVYSNADGKPAAAAFAGEDMDEAAGCVFVAMDISFYIPAAHPEIDETPLLENIQRFLKTCNDTDGDGASDDAEKAAKTDPADPDSDDDGFCDGWGLVPGVCVRGETLGMNSDDDDVIDSLDPDDDNDGIPTSVEGPAEALNPNTDDDRTPTWRDVDSDGDNRPDSVEGMADRDGDGIPGLVDRGDEPESCDSTEDCVVYPPENVCNVDTGFCASGAGTDAGVPGAGGRGPTDGGATADGGTSSGGRSGNTGGRSTGCAPRQDGGSTGAEGGDTSNEIDAGSADGGGPRRRGRSGDDGGCGCRTTGSPHAPSSLIVALGAVIVAAARRRVRAERPARA